MDEPVTVGTLADRRPRRDTMSFRITSLQAEMIDMTSFNGEPNMAIGRVLVIATDGHTRLQWYSTIKDAPRIGDVWIGLPPTLTEEAHDG